MKCVMCGATAKLVGKGATRTVDLNIELTGARITGVPQYKCPKCDEVYTELPPLDRLLEVFAQLVAVNPDRLKGQEIRFLRKRLGFSAQDFAKYFMVAPSTVSRWEHDAQPMDPFKEKVLRDFARRGALLDDYGPDIAPSAHPAGRTNEVYVVDFADVEPVPAKKAL